MLPAHEIPDLGRLKGRVLVAITFTTNTVVFTFEPDARAVALGPIEHTCGVGKVREEHPLATTGLVSAVGLTVQEALCNDQGDLKLELGGHTIALLNDEVHYEAYSVQIDGGPETIV